MDDHTNTTKENTEKAGQRQASHDILSGALTGIVLALVIVLGFKLISSPDLDETPTLITKNPGSVTSPAKVPPETEGETPQMPSATVDQQNTASLPETGGDAQATINQSKMKEVPGLYPEASTIILQQEELTNRTDEELQLMRNEIFARHSYIFKNPEVSNYFEKQSWHRKEHPNVSDRLSRVEIANIKLIQKYERKKTTPQVHQTPQEVRTSTIRFLPAIP